MLCCVRSWKVVLLGLHCYLYVRSQKTAHIPQVQVFIPLALCLQLTYHNLMDQHLGPQSPKLARQCPSYTNTDGDDRESDG